jgi:hypothetical protein
LSLKRNSYFEKFGITTLTITDSILADIRTAFASIVKNLEPATQKKSAGPAVATAIVKYYFDPGNNL